MAKRSYPLRIEPWSAVRIATHGETCTRAVAMRDKRLLARDAPALPLQGCTMSASCKCIYRHYADRRAGSRRVDTASETWTPGSPGAPGERRGSRGPRGRRDPG